MIRKAILSALFAGMVLAGCSSAPIRELGLDKYAPRKAEQELSAGIASYEDGNYKAALRSLQSALDQGLTFKSDKVSAYKYQAFIYCASEREKQCRDTFRKLLEVDPSFELSAAEAGHPIWGTVFRSVKSEVSTKKK